MSHATGDRIGVERGRSRGARSPPCDVRPTKAVAAPFECGAAVWTWVWRGGAAGTAGGAEGGGGGDSGSARAADRFALRDVRDQFDRPSGWLGSRVGFRSAVIGRRSRSPLVRRAAVRARCRPTRARGARKETDRRARGRGTIRGYSIRVSRSLRSGGDRKPAGFRPCDQGGRTSGRCR